MCSWFIFSNPILYAKCLNELGLKAVHKYQGREPSGRTFNEIALDHRGKSNFSKANSEYEYNTFEYEILQIKKYYKLISI